jgi:competence protein ComEC
MFGAVLQEIAPPQNPGSFDYKRYMAADNVYHQGYINYYSWKTIKKPTGINIYLIADRIRNYFVNVLKNNNLSGKELAVAAALMLGQRDALDYETMQDYSGSGVIHILSVSGLHVGVIYLVINFLLGFFSKKKWQVYLKSAIIIITIWAYALLTGLSPSVSRAALMFTFITLGNMSSRYVHIINSLSISAFVLLLLDPWVITKIGFQL